MTEVPAPSDSPPLSGVLVVDLSTTLPGAQATQFLADAGADVVLVESPGGSPLRREPGWPGLLRGKRSVVLDLHAPADRATLDGLLEQADVVITTMRPKAAERLGLSPENLAVQFPRLVAARITGWGSRGPWADRKGYEALVLAKTGVLHSKRSLSPGPGPAYVSTPYASFGAAHAAVQGILAALIERQTSGRGQLVESDLVTGVGAYDTYNWFYELVLKRYPDAFKPMDSAFDEDGRPQAKLMYALLVAPTADDVWLQFAETTPRLMAAWLDELDLAEELKDPKWAGFPLLATPELRSEWWNKMLAKVRQRTLTEWEKTFAEKQDVFGEQFRSPEQALDHPQIRFEGRVIEVDDPELGAVTQPSTLAHTGGRPLSQIRPAPRLDEHRGEIRELAERPHQAVVARSEASAAVPCTPPLAGVTIIEFGAMFAGPYGATLLADLGARVIKFEPIEGDTIRGLMVFPEAGGAKVMQGKESIAINLRSPEARDILQEFVRRADIVLQTYRGGVAERMGVDEATLRAVNPDLVYVNHSGYGLEGPYAARAAFAPSIAAAGGVSATDAHVVTGALDDDEDVRALARRLWAAGTVPAVQTDGMAALGTASTLLIGLYAQRHGRKLTRIGCTMLGSALQLLIAQNTTYAGKPDPIWNVDPEFRGLGALYRMYRASDGWILLAAPQPQEWDDLLVALENPTELVESRFATAQDRADSDEALAKALGSIFATRPAEEWEERLSAADVGCVQVTQEPAERHMQGDEFYEAGYAVDAFSPVFDEHRRLAPITRFSRSATQAEGGCTIGQHTNALLHEIGYDDERIGALRAHGVIA